MNVVLRTLRRTSLLMMALLLLAAWVAADLTIFTRDASAAMITSRSLKLSSSANGAITTATPGDGGNGLKAKHTVTFTMASSAATIGSIAIIYCDNPIPQTTCNSSTATTGNESNLTSAAVTGIGGTWSLDTTTTNPAITNYGTCNGATTTRNNCVLVKASSATALTGTPTVTITYGGGASNYVTNPTTDNSTFYARIVVFATTAYATVVDSGSTANSTAQQIDITAKVQETLNFSVGSPAVASVPAAGTTCAPFTDPGALTLGDTNGVLNFTTAFDAYSWFRLSTNANGGTIVYYSGDTLKNSTGTGTITAIGTTATASAPGTAQFGLALDSTQAAHSFTNLTKTAPYATGNGTITAAGTAQFAYDTTSIATPLQIASASGPVVCDTGAVRYLGNISTTIPPGIYTTTITYIAAPTY